ncbi:hypothetical protein ACFXP7_13660 [Microbacterium sp. P06]|uniref:hypothetical protein n=1 Tax=unclassified Microbacterium TaxID=2609290 RepID=UPI003745DC76
MKINFAKVAAVVTLAAAATFAPLAANAYPSGDEASVSSPTVGPGGTVEFSVEASTFVPGEPVTISLTGENASAGSLAVVKSVVQTSVLDTRPAAADGSLPSVGVRLPANASGTYTITAASPSVPEGVSAAVTVVTSGGNGGGGGLPATGMDSGSLLGLWVGGGALVLAGGAVAVGAAVHRQRKQAA